MVMSGGWQGWVTLALILLMLVALIAEIAPPYLVMMGTLIIFIPLGILDLEQALHGFNDDAVLSIAVLFVVAKGIELSGGLEYVSKLMFKTPKTDEKVNKLIGKQGNSIVWILLRFTVPVAIFSAFLANIPLVAMMIPPIIEFSRKVNMAPSKLLLPLSYAALLGGTLTLIGTSTNLVVVSLAAKKLPQLQMSFFEIGIVGVPVTVASFLYMFSLSGKLLPDRLSVQSTSINASAIGDTELEAGDCLLMVTEGTEFVTKHRNNSTFALVSQLPGFQPIQRRRALIAALFAVLMVVGSGLGVDLVLSSLFSAAGLLITRCLSPRDAMESIELPVLIMIAAAFGISEAMVQSGAADLVAKALMGLAGPSQFGLITWTYIATTLFSLAITNNAAVTIMFPVALSAAQTGNLDFRPFAYVLMLASSAGLMTPTGSPTNLMVYGPGGYRFTDYIIYGGPMQD